MTPNDKLMRINLVYLHRLISVIRVFYDSYIIILKLNIFKCIKIVSIQSITTTTKLYIFKCINVSTIYSDYTLDKLLQINIL